MKYRLLGFLKCPECGDSPLGFEIFEARDTLFRANISKKRCIYFCAFEKEGYPLDCNKCYTKEICSGILICNRCHNFYPVINGIPRFNPDWAEDFPQFAQQYKFKFSKQAQARGVLGTLRQFKESQAATKKSFGFEWLRYAVSDKQENTEAFFSQTGVNEDFLRTKVILDAGCGMGRYLIVSARDDNEVVGIDLSVSVERAYKITKDLPFVYIIQGDLMRPPLREKIFEFVYSLGVLHHTPDTKKAFQSISRLVGGGGRISIWVYQTWAPPNLKAIHKRVFAKAQGFITDNIRKITMRLPLKLLHYICYIAIPLGWLQIQISRNKSTKIIFWPLLLLCVSTHKKWQIRLLDTFDWYSPQYQWKHTYDEVLSWFKEGGFCEIKKTSSVPIGVTGIKG